MKVGFIGLGNMGSTLARCVAQVSGVELLLSTYNLENATTLQQEIGGTLLPNEQIIAQANCIFLGIKPQMLRSFKNELANSLTQRPQITWVSMLAGVTIDTLQTVLETHNIVRIMPNTPVSIGKGITTLTSNNEQVLEQVSQLLEKSGEIITLPETLMDSATAIAGCGPAFVYTFIEALADAGVKHGLPRELALKLAAQTVSGAGDMVLESGTHPALLRDAVCSPGGSTIAGVTALEKNGFRHATIEAVNKAVKRTKELG